MRLALALAMAAVLGQPLSAAPVTTGQSAPTTPTQTLVVPATAVMPPVVRDGYEVSAVPPPATDPASVQAYAASLVGDDWQFECLVQLWNGESGWRYDAENAESEAYGIAQAWPAEKYATAGDDWLTNPQTQIRWGLDYIVSSYGTPCAAWEMWQSREPHWY